MKIYAVAIYAEKDNSRSIFCNAYKTDSEYHALAKALGEHGSANNFYEKFAYRVTEVEI